MLNKLELQRCRLKVSHVDHILKKELNSKSLKDDPTTAEKFSQLSGAVQCLSADTKNLQKALKLGHVS